MTSAVPVSSKGILVQEGDADISIDDRMIWSIRPFCENLGHGTREIVLLISAREDITEAVQAQLNRDQRAGMQFYKVHKEGNFSEEETDWMEFVHRIKDEVKKIREDGVTRVYLYTNVPVVMGVFIGALLDNGPEVIVHHFFGGVYRRIGTMTHETAYV